ncbi:MAG: hypothetical protein M1826_007078 [Phylliscum demangeonii]|nr:MAG: hypothetical protein M1826_007078 [Phylliscum demangeonii]
MTRFFGMGVMAISAGIQPCSLPTHAGEVSGRAAGSKRPSVAKVGGKVVSQDNQGGKVVLSTLDENPLKLLRAKVVRGVSRALTVVGASNISLSTPNAGEDGDEDSDEDDDEDEDEDKDSDKDSDEDDDEDDDVDGRGDG